MTYTALSLLVLLLAVLMAAGVLLVPVAFLAGNVFHVWGTTSAQEWSSEVLLRLFTGSLRRRLMKRVNRQCSVAVDKSRRAHPYLVVAVSPGDVRTLTGPGGSLSLLASHALRGYVRHSRAEGWPRDVEPQVAVVPDEQLRRGTIRVRPVSRPELAEARAEMSAYDDAVGGNLLVPASAPSSSHTAEHEHTTLLSDDGVMKAAPEPEEATRESTPADAVTMPVTSTRLVLGDAHGRKHAVTTDSALIGRGPDCTVQLASAEVSREHVSVYLQDGTWWLRDRGSRNGTVVDGTRVHGAGPVRLRQGSRIVLGSLYAGETLTIATLVEA